MAWLDGAARAGKRQPNLLFAAYRLIAGTPSGWPEFRALLGERRDEVEAVMLERRTQTNEPARCALLLPLLAALPQPLALLEVGASAGLCLLPDRYGYDYDGYRSATGRRPAPHAEGNPPLPADLPEIVWRAGLDLNPIDLTDAEQVRWLELLIWPGMEYRLEMLHEAVAVARQDPPRVVEGDLTTATSRRSPPRRRPTRRWSSSTPRSSTTCRPRAVSASARRSRRSARRGWPCEGPRRARLPEGPPDTLALAQDGRRVAWADGHGARLSWG